MIPSQKYHMKNHMVIPKPEVPHEEPHGDPKPEVPHEEPHGDPEARSTT